MDRRVEIGVLGPVELRVDGALVRLSSQPQRVVLARLALSYGRAVPALDLVGALWVGEPPANAIGNLHGYVSKLRQLIGRDRIVRDPGGYRLAVAAAQLDVERARALVTAGRAAADPRAARDSLGAAVALWRGDPLSDLDEALAFAPDLAGLAEWHRQIREEWLGASIDAGEAVAVLPVLEQAVAAEPLRESLCRLWMRALHLTGRTADALAAAAAFRQRLADESGLDPSPELQRLQRDILSDDPGLRARPAGPVGPAGPTEERDLPGVAASRLPAPRDRFIGRSRELAQLDQALLRQRVVTVVGPGGVGKTRILLEYLAKQPDPYLVELAAVETETAVATLVASALGLRAAPEGAPAAIADRLGRRPVLLAIDNCEHVLDVTRELVDDLLVRCPGLRVIATSRQRLGLPDETVIRLGPLADDEQVDLFCDRAARLRGDFEPSPPVRQLAADVCRLLDGLPLAVELAARREAAFGLRQLRDRLASGLDILEPARDGNRSTAVTATVEWSYRLLDDDARRLFDRLCVCVGGFGLDALDHLAPPGASNPHGLLADLVDASLVLSDVSVDPPRYRLLEVMRHVGLGHLGGDDHDRARQAHADWMTSYVEKLFAVRRERSGDTTSPLRREAGNLEASLGWLMSTGKWDEAVRLAVPLAAVVSEEPRLGVVAQLRRFAPTAGLVAQDRTTSLRLLVAGAAEWMAGDAARGEAMLDRAVDSLAPDDEYRWIARFFRLSSGMYTGNVAAVEADAVALDREPGVPVWAISTGLCCAALINLFTGDREAARIWLRRQPAVLEEIGTRDGFVAYTYGEVLAYDDPEGALAWFDKAYAVSDANGHTFNREIALIGRVALLIRLGRLALAARLCGESIRGLRRAGMVPQAWTALRLAAELLVAVDDPHPAAVLLAAAAADPFAPPVRGPDLVRQEAQWTRIGELLGASAADLRSRRIPGGRAAAVDTALTALARHAGGDAAEDLRTSG